MTNDVRVTSPGRICLFGEHQDYLGLPVIAAAISLRIGVSGRHTADDRVTVDLPDIGGRLLFPLGQSGAYTSDRDYFRSGIVVAEREGLTFHRGMECTVRGAIPIGAGTSSSSALVAAWIRFLGLMSDQQREFTPAETTRLAHAAEVLEFGEPGGMMDHVTAVYGGLVHIGFEPTLSVESLCRPAGAIVLGDSLEPKDTKGILRRVKEKVVALSASLARVDPGFSLRTVMDAHSYRRHLTPDELRLLGGTITNRRLTEKAHEALRAPVPDGRAMGRMLNAHQDVLRDVLGISTPKIDRMLEAALAAGAWGGKINGSGGGGCMFAYAPVEPENVAEAIRRAGGRATLLTIDEGTRVENNAP